MDNDTFQDFEAHARTRGFDEVLERQWPALAVVGTHQHPFAVHARLVQGEMWLTVADDTRHLQAGDTFDVDRSVPHAERYGNAGASIWVARRNVD